MEAIYFGTCSIWGRGSGSGPWVMADLENGLWAGANRTTPSNTPLVHPFVFAMVCVCARATHSSRVVWPP